jgi:hypothetical protein
MPSRLSLNDNARLADQFSNLALQRLIQANRHLHWIHRAGGRVYRLGERTVIEAFAEIDAGASVAEVLERYSDLTPEILYAGGGNQTVPWRPLLVPAP